MKMAEGGFEFDNSAYDDRIEEEETNVDDLVEEETNVDDPRRGNPEVSPYSIYDNNIKKLANMAIERIVDRYYEK